ncbi:phytoene desaturase family protein [Corynebacterium sp. A21]|uniref:phytoene desaturase family protein n=1 Tax=Corynebacterium sp. A21 TaxID=3457318 RepID=UPI003FD048E1
MKVLVIGAGFAGLATAGLLAKAGHEVQVVEALDGPGGRADSLEFEGFRFDTGPSWYLMPDAFDHFYRQMGTTTAAELDLVDLDPGYRVYTGERAPLDIPATASATIELFEGIEPGAGEKLRAHLRSAGETYTLALERFLYTTFDTPAPFLHPKVIARVGELLRLLLEPLERKVNRDFEDPQIRQTLSYPAVFLSSEPKAIPSLYHLMSHTDLVQGVRYPQGGFNAVVSSLHRLAVEAGVVFHFNTPVSEILVEDGRAVGVHTPGKVWRADAVVSGADLHHTETTLLPRRWRSRPERTWRRRDPGLGAVLVLLGVQGELPQLAHHTLLLSEDWDPDFAAVYGRGSALREHGASHSIYVSKPSASDPGVAPEGQENLFILVPVPADPEIGRGTAYGTEQASGVVAGIAEQAIARLAEQAGIPDLNERILVRRTLGPGDFAERYHAWSGGALGLAHTLRQSAFFRGSNTSAKVSGLYYAGSTTLPGVGVPMCLISADNVRRSLLRDQKRGILRKL